MVHRKISFRSFVYGFGGLILKSLLLCSNLLGETPGVLQLAEWETQANGLATRTNAPIKVYHYDVPAELIDANIAAYIPAEIKDALFYEKRGKRFFRWILNPEDKSFGERVRLFLQKNGYSTRKYSHFTGRLTASASLILTDPAGTSFSVKVSTDRAPGDMGAWREILPVHAQKARTNSDLLHSLAPRLRDHIVFQYEVLGATLPEIGNSLLIRDLGDVARGTNTYLAPGFSTVHETAGKELAKANFIDSPYEFLKDQVAVALGKGWAQLLAKTGAFLHAPHGQNWLIEMDSKKQFTGRIVIRDLQDLHFLQSFVESQPELFRKFPVHPKAIENKPKIGIGLTHHSGTPSWLDVGVYSKHKKMKTNIDVAFFQSFASEFQKVTGTPIRGLVNFMMTDHNYSAFEIPVLPPATFGCPALLQKVSQHSP